MKITDLDTYTVTTGGTTTSQTPQVTKTQQQKSGAPGFARGLGMSALGTLRGAGELGEKIGNLAIGKGFETNQGSVYNPKSKVGQKLKEAQTPKTAGESIGKFTGDVAQFAVPGGAVTKATRGAGMVSKFGTRALTSGGTAAVQSGEIGGDSAIAAGAELAIPAAGVAIRPAARLVGNLLKGTGAALSGASADVIDQIVKNPQKAAETAKAIRETGSASILRENAKKIVGGISNIKKEARQEFGKGLESLSKSDIKPAVFRKHAQDVLNKYGSEISAGKRRLTNIEFDDPKNIKKASELIKRLNTTELDGKSLRKLADDIESSKYKIATGDERLAFNAFINDLSKSVKNAISESTGKLDKINAKFSTDMQIAEGMEKIFGKVKFKNMKEIMGVSQKLENLFSQKGLAPEMVDDFMKRIGVSADDFKTSEAVRQIGQKSIAPNQVGINPMEMIRNVTSGVVSPKMVGTIATKFGIAKQSVQKIMDKLDPVGRAAFIRLLTGIPDQEPDGQ